MNLYGECANIEAIEERVKQRLIARKDHDTLRGVRLYNYTPKAQFDKAWDDHTLQCRGLITDADGLILARPFPKFFNYEDSAAPSHWDEPFSVTNKMDGSMFLLRSLGEYELCATRGSFTSRQAEMGRDILRLEYRGIQWDPNITYIFELIHPHNRIVVDYGNVRGLVLLGMIDTKTGNELDLKWAPRQLSVVPHFIDVDIKSGDALKALEFKNEEGFVVRFFNGSRVKVKFEEYKRLHRIVTGCSSKTIWENFRDGKGTEGILHHVPDEFYVWAKGIMNSLTAKYTALEQAARSLVHRADTDGAQTRKEEALYFREHGSAQEAAVAFAMLDSKPYDHIIWKFLEPAYEQPFSSRELA